MDNLTSTTTGVEMYMRVTGLFAAALCLGASQNVFAADMPVKAPMYTKAPAAVAAYSWAGGYVGGNLGAAWSKDRVSASQAFPVPPFFAVDAAGVSSAASQSIKASGFTGGLQAGYNWQSSQWVLGLEADINYLDLKKNVAGVFQFPSTLPGGPVGPPATFFNVNQSISNQWLFTARPRLGWASNNWLIYGTGGLAVGGVKFSQLLVLGAPTTETSNISTTRVGWTAGGGVEYAVNTKWSVKAEYLYADLGKVSTVASMVNPAFAGAFVTNSVRVTENVARLGLNYHY